MYLCEEYAFIEKNCKCNKSIETLYHLYKCEFFNDKEHKIPFNKIYNGNLYEQKEILNTMISIFDKWKKSE